MDAPQKRKSKCTIEGDLDLLRRYRNADRAALAELFEVHFGLVMGWARQLSKTLDWVNLDDVIQLASLGFIKAADTFDESRNPYFDSWAERGVMWEVYNSDDVRIAKRTLYGNYINVIRAQDELSQQLERKPTLEEVGERTNLSVQQIENALNVIAAFPLPLEPEEGKPIKESYQIENPYEGKLINEVFKQLSPYEAKIMILHYCYGYSDPEIAQILGKSKGAIKTARTRALEKLRKRFGR